MGIKALLTFDYGKSKMDSLRDLGYDITFIEDNKVRSVPELLDTEVIVCYDPFKALDITKMNKLKWIQLSSAGIDQLPINYVKQEGIVITNNKGGYSIPMGEWVVLKILEMLKHSFKLYKNQENKLWKMDSSVVELCGKTVGFLGTGEIAKQSAKRLQGFETRILGTNTSGSETEYFHKCYSNDETAVMLKQCDIVVITVPYTNSTHKMIDKNMINIMKDGVYIVNVARGSIIDEAALISELNSGKIAAAALDVVEEEPLTMESPLWSMENVIITPHNSWMSEKKDERRFNLFYENLKNYAEGKELKNKVNLSKGY
ncbi:MAG: phosphoglycerate dehydrogenase [Solirubrobacterales bacterium]